METYEYAGFLFEVIRSEGMTTLKAVPGQHPAAYKDRHLRAARECFEEDTKERRDV